MPGAEGPFPSFSPFFSNLLQYLSLFHPHHVPSPDPSPSPAPASLNTSVAGASFLQETGEEASGGGN